MTHPTKKYLIIGSPLTTVGGIITGLRSWLSNVPKDASVEVLYGSGCDEAALFAHAAGAPRTRLTRSSLTSRFARVLVLPPALLALVRILRARPSVVLSFFPWTMLASGLATRVARWCGVNVRHVIYLAGNPLPPVQARWQQRFYKRLFSVTLHMCEDIVVLSDRLARLLAAEYQIPSRVHVRVVPISISIRSEAKQATAEEGGRRRATFGMVTRLSREKGCEVAICAFSSISGMLSDNLLIYGAGPEEDQLRELTHRLGVSDRVDFAGWTDSLDSAYREIDCILVPSFTEGTPRTILEAAAVGVPCIASAVGGIPDLIINGRTGWLVEPGDVAGLADTMAKLVENREAISVAGLAARKAMAARPSPADEFMAIFSYEPFFSKECG